MITRRSVAPSPSRILRIRSWVSGLAALICSISIEIARASGTSIQIGKSRLSATASRTTTGAFELGSMTRLLTFISTALESGAAAIALAWDRESIARRRTGKNFIESSLAEDDACSLLHVTESGRAKSIEAVDQALASLHHLE